MQDNKGDVWEFMLKPKIPQKGSRLPQKNYGSATLRNYLFLVLVVVAWEDWCLWVLYFSESFLKQEKIRVIVVTYHRTKIKGKFYVSSLQFKFCKFLDLKIDSKIHLKTFQNSFITSRLTRTSNKVWPGWPLGFFKDCKLKKHRKLKCYLQKLGKKILQQKVIFQVI